MRVCFEFECGDDTCYIEKGKWCKFLIYNACGFDGRCSLFGNVPLDNEKEDGTGGSLRCLMCKALKEVKVTEEGLL